MQLARKLHVIKRNGKTEQVYYDKITARISKLCYGLNMDYVDPALLGQKIHSGMYPGIHVSEIDELAAETAAHLTSRHPDYGVLAARLCVSNLHKETKSTKSFSTTMRMLHEYVNRETGKLSPKISDETWNVIEKHKDRLDSSIIHYRDFSYDYFGFKTLERSYLLKINGKIIERPQHLVMRVAIGIHGDDLEAILETYELMSNRWFTHATPTLFNAGTTRPQMSSCFLLTVEDDSIDGIYSTLAKCAKISKYAGGIGVSMHKIRASGSYIDGTNGHSNGLVPMLRVYNNTARYVDQGGGKRKGSFAIYLEPWHADVYAFLDLKKNHGKEEDRARDLFYAMWIPDLFMERVRDDGDWSLFCPHESPGLPDCHGKEFNTLYERYESEGRARETVKARALWAKITEAEMETGTPYIMFKDSCNLKSNQQNLGTIRSSNLCTEILEYTAPDEVAVCNLASIALPRFMDMETGKFNHQKLFEVTKTVTRNLNRVIDRTFYPVEEARTSNMRHRPIGLGVQGLADTFMMMRVPFTSPEAKLLNWQIFETMYFAALTASMELSKIDGPYSSFQGSPASKGILQFDMWKTHQLSGRWDWESLKADIVKYGIRNSLLMAPMPTASTSQILGNIECFEAINSNLGVRRTLAGEFVCVVRHLLTHLIELGLWNEDVRNQLIRDNGSVQNIECIPKDVREIYKTVFEIKGKHIIDMAADRGRFIDQSQSFNVHMPNANYGKLTSSHFYAWEQGLKGIYYLRTKAAVDAIKFTLDCENIIKPKDESEAAATIENVNSASIPVPPNNKEEADDAEEGTTNTATTIKSAKQMMASAVSQSLDEAKAETTRAAIACSLANKDDCLSCGS